MLIWSRILLAVATLAAVWAVTQDNMVAALAFPTLIAFAFVLRAEHFEQAHHRSVHQASAAQQKYTIESQIRNQAELRAITAEALQYATESTLIRLTALWSRTIRPTTAQRYATRIMNLKGEAAALASAVMLSRAATDARSTDLAHSTRVLGLAEGGPVLPVRDGSSDVVPSSGVSDRAVWSLVPGWVWRTVAGAVAFVVGVVVWGVWV